MPFLSSANRENRAGVGGGGLYNPAFLDED